MRRTVPHVNIWGETGRIPEMPQQPMCGNTNANTNTNVRKYKHTHKMVPHTHEHLSNILNTLLHAKAPHMIPRNKHLCWNSGFKVFESLKQNKCHICQNSSQKHESWWWVSNEQVRKMNEWYPGCTICTNTNECTISTTTEHEAGEWWHFNECCFDLRAWISFSKVF